MARSQSDIEADISALEAARTKRLLGQVRSKVTYEGVSTEIALPTLEEIEMGIARLRVELARVTGGSSGIGPIRVGFGGRT